MLENRIISIEKQFSNFSIARWFINRYALILLGMVIVLIGTSFSLVFASSWNIQTVEHWGDNGTDNSIALDSLGRVHISYLEFDDLNRIYYLKYAFWDGNAWQKQSLAQNGDLPGKISLVLDSNDRPHICYTYSRLGYPAVLGYAKWNGSTWESLAVDYGASGSLSLDNYDRPHISYSYPYSVIINNVRVSRSDLKYAYWNGQNWQIQTIEYGGRIGEESSLALDGQMRPHVAYRDFGVVSGQLKYAAWNGLAWQIQIVDNQGDAGKNPSLALDSVDRPCISYAGGDYSLKYVSHNGATWQIQTVEAFVAQYFLPNSLVLDQDDCPHISYQNNVLSILKYAVWDGSGWRIQIVDSSNKPGLYNSLALDSEKRPHISYYEMIYGDLKYATVEVDMQDGDGDGLFDYIENATCTDPFDVDSDDDGISDGEEDLNHNGMVDGSETDPCNPDSDDDGIQDGTEIGISEPVLVPDGDELLLGTDTTVFILDADPTTTTDPLNADSDDDGIPDGVEDANCNGRIDLGETDPSDPLSCFVGIELRKGFNLIAIPEDVTKQPDLKDWLSVLGDSLEIEKVMVYDDRAGKFITMIPGDTSNPGFMLKGGEGFIVYARQDKEVTFTTVLCSTLDLKPGFNLVGFAYPQTGYTAFQLLNDLGIENVSSFQRYSIEKGAFETAGFASDGQLVGIDFPIISGEGYFLFMKQEVLNF